MGFLCRQLPGDPNPCCHQFNIQCCQRNCTFEALVIQTDCGSRHELLRIVRGCWTRRGWAEEGWGCLHLPRWRARGPKIKVTLSESFPSRGCADACTGLSIITPRTCTLVPEAQVSSHRKHLFLQKQGPSQQPIDTPFSFLGTNEADLGPMLAASGRLLCLGLGLHGRGQLLT